MKVMAKAVTLLYLSFQSNQHSTRYIYFIKCIFPLNAVCSFNKGGKTLKMTLLEWSTLQYFKNCVILKKWERMFNSLIMYDAPNFVDERDDIKSAFYK